MNATEFKLSPDCAVHVEGATFYFSSPQEAASFVSGEERLIQLGAQFRAAMAAKARELQMLARLDQINRRLAELDAFLESNYVDPEEAAALGDEVSALTQERESLNSVLIDLNQVRAFL